MDIKPGTKVTVEITASPRNAAARKTLLRLFRKDADNARQLRWRDRHRPSWQTKRRGGRPWHHQMRSKLGVGIQAGHRCSLRATVDVIRDLASVERWVKVSRG